MHDNAPGQIPVPPRAADPSCNAPAFTLRPTRFSFNDDLVLSAKTRLQLDECLARLRFHRTIYQDWGFAAVDPMGMTAILNFYGPPGTGKTLCAEALAGHLGLPFMALGIAELESKFMGDTARNIQAAFAQATETGALLFFDEADTLLGKRLSSVNQGVDNEVNAMRSTLLIELERYEGIVVFATNFAGNYDEAFRSRIGYHIEFNLPDLAAREQLWSRFLVEQIPLGSPRDLLLSEATMQSEGLSGREIRTCMRLALPKALLAAEHEGGPAQLQMAHIQQAIDEVQTAQRQVAIPNTHATKDAKRAKALLGID
ncbi:ATP-binding protein [Pseudomonas shirazica]|uniref:ATP-binding protein n=1 Tax=Pseudomonas shirazica TaxID=1940636 RepID=UPI001EDE3056|nr:ATP-binding protein [Pseudomonas shirazica]